MAQAVPSSGWHHARAVPADGAADPDPAMPMAGLVGIAPATTLAVFDLPAGASANRGQIDGSLDGTALPRPVLSTRLPLRGGGTRCLVLVRRGAADLARSRLEFRLADRRVAFTDPDWLQSPLRPCDDLIDGLAAAAVPRLVRFLLPNVGPQIAPDGVPAFRATVQALLDRLDVARGQLAAVCPVGPRGAILTYRVSGGPGALPTDATLLGERAVEGVARLAALAEGTDLLHLFLPRANLPQTPDIVLAGSRPLRLAADGGPVPRQTDLGAWLDRRPAAVRTWAEGVLSQAARADAGLAVLLADARVQPDECPQVVRAHLVATRGGVLVWVDIADPTRVAAELLLQGSGRTARAAIPVDGHLRAFLPWQAPHVAAAVAPRPGDAARLRLIGRSGRELSAVEVRMSDMGAAMPDDLAGGNAEAAATSLARAWGDRIRPDLSAQVLSFGTAPGAPRLTLLVPLTPDPDLIRARAAFAAGEPAGAEVEIDCLSVGHPNPALLALLGQVARVTGVCHRVIVVPAGTTPADALVAALGAVRAPDVTLLGATVLPDAPGWLQPWCAALGRLAGSGILGGTVLHPDGSVHHAGGRLAMSSDGLPRAAWTGTGLPAADLGAGDTLRSDLFTTEAVGLTAAGRAAILGAGACLPDPDLVLLPAILRAGAGQVSPAHRFVRFGGSAAPDPVLRSASLRLIADASADHGDGAPDHARDAVDADTTDEAA